MSRDPRDLQKDMEIIQAYKSSEDYNAKHEKTFMGIPVVVVLEHYVQQVKQLKEDNVRWTCKHTAAEQKYQTQSNVIAELRKELEIELRGRMRWSEVAKGLNNDVLSEKERADKAEERELELKEAIERAISQSWGIGISELLGIKNELEVTLHPLDREDTNDN